VLAGFVVCFFGDVFRISESRKMFVTGLVSFLAGHLMYIMVFHQLADFDVSVVFAVAGILCWDCLYIMEVSSHWQFQLVSWLKVNSLPGNQILRVSTNFLLLPTPGCQELTCRLTSYPIIGNHRRK
jgi:hypothetical protein